MKKIAFVFSMLSYLAYLIIQNTIIKYNHKKLRLQKTLFQFIKLSLSWKPHLNPPQTGRTLVPSEYGFYVKELTHQPIGELPFPFG
jgi:hypothetical protein